MEFNVAMPKQTIIVFQSFNKNENANKAHADHWQSFKTRQGGKL